MEKVNIILVRHGESIANSLNVIGGSLDYELTEKGYIQAKKVADRLENIYIDRIYSSDLKRARCTAKYIANKQNILEEDIIIKKEFREIDFGECEKYTFSECKKLYEKEYILWREINKYPEGFKGQESIENVAKRFRQGIEDILRENKDLKTICIVSHSVAIKSFITFAIYKDKKYFKDLKKLDNTGIYILELNKKNNEYKIIIDADSTHL